MSVNLPQKDLSLNLQEHGICFVVPSGAIVTGEFDLPGGALIQGRLTGRIFCRTGSLIVTRGGEFCGQADADRVYIEGRVFPASDGRMSTIKGRRLVAISEMAEGSADLYAQAFAIHTYSFSASFTTLERS